MTYHQIQTLLALAALFVISTQFFRFLGSLIMFRLEETKEERRQLRAPSHQAILEDAIRAVVMKRIVEARKASQEDETKTYGSRTLPGVPPPPNSRRHAPVQGPGGSKVWGR